MQTQRLEVEIRDDFEELINIDHQEEEDTPRTINAEERSKFWLMVDRPHRTQSTSSFIARTPRLSLSPANGGMPASFI